MNTHLEKILAGRHHDPFQYLGAHFSTPVPDRVTLRTFQPGATAVRFVQEGGELTMSCLHPDGLFELELAIEALADPFLDPFHYRYAISYPDGRTKLSNDPYRFTVQLGEQDRFLFNAGRNYRLYDHFGAHPTLLHHIEGVLFRVWAPNARRVR
jgi:1,4-alpha-glucan branching enzyme